MTITFEELCMENKAMVRDHLLQELPVNTRVALYNEWIAEQTDEETINFFKDMTKDQVADYMKDEAEFAEVLDWHLDQVAGKELGDNYNIDWTGLEEQFGLR